MEVSGSLPISPRPASRPRFTCRGRFAVAYTDKPYAGWMVEIAPLLEEVVIPEGWDPAAPLAMNVMFKVQKPKTSKLLYPKPDIDNYEKSILDAITKRGGIWDDDSQVVTLTSTKMFVEEGEGIDFVISPAKCLPTAN